MTRSGTTFFQKFFLLTLGLFLALGSLELGMRLTGAALLAIQEYKNLSALKQKHDCVIMCIGESTTQNAYPSYLEKILNQGKTGIRFSVIDKGRGGVTTDAILADLPANLERYRPDIVITMMGINDWGRHMPYETPSASMLQNALHSLKVYKLLRFFRLHIKNKFNTWTNAVFQSLRSEFSILRNSLNPGHAHDFPTKTSAAQHHKPTLIGSQTVTETSLDISSQNLTKAVDLRLEGNHSAAEKAYQKVIQLNPSNELAYIELGEFYRLEGRFNEAEKCYQRAITLNPRNDTAYAHLAHLYEVQPEFKKEHVEHLFRTAIALNPRNDRALYDLAKIFMDQQKFAEAEPLLREAIKSNPRNYFAYVQLGWIYERFGGILDAKALYQEALELDMDQESRERLCKALAGVSSAMGDDVSAKQFADSAAKLTDNYYVPMTLNNYRALERMLSQKNILWVCVQYPMRDVNPLKRIFRKNGSRIVFVTNEEVFKRAVRKNGFDAYFSDRFGGDFGHCTSEGNRLLAANIAREILRQVFKR